jgi:phage shock protein A
MALLERVTTLIRANINDLIERAEDPDRLIKQVILDMRNQLLQVKTQVAIAITDQHLLKRKQKEQEDQAAEWMRKADVAVGRGEEQLARLCLDKALSSRTIASAYHPQISHQNEQVENLKTALLRLQTKLAETESEAEMLIARHRRSRIMQRAGDAQSRVEDLSEPAESAAGKVMVEEAIGLASSEMTTPTPEDRVARMERETEIERMLAELKRKPK